MSIEAIQAIIIHQLAVPRDEIHPLQALVEEDQKPPAMMPGFYLQEATLPLVLAVSRPSLLEIGLEGIKGINNEQGHHRLSVRLPGSRRGSGRGSGYHGSGRSRHRECEECSRGSTKIHPCKRSIIPGLRLPVLFSKIKLF